MDEIDPYDIAARSRRNRENPSETFQQLLRLLWQGNSPEEALATWRYQVARGRWLAEDMLYALGMVLAAPPANLAEQIVEHAWVRLTPAAGEAPSACYLAWASELAAQLRAIYAEETGVAWQHPGSGAA